MNAYIVKLSGQGDTLIKLVDQETWDWINLNESGRPEDNPHLWEDLLCPNSIKERIINNSPDPHNQREDIMISSGSWQNDRAIFAPVLEDKNKFFAWDTLSSLDIINKAKENGYDVLDEFEGHIY